MPDGLTDEAKAEIAAAAAIVRKDFSRQTMHDVLAEYKVEKREKPPEPELDDDGKPKPPPKKDPEDAPVPKKRGLWWTEDEPNPEDKK